VLDIKDQQQLNKLASKSEVKDACKKITQELIENRIVIVEDLVRSLVSILVAGGKLDESEVEVFYRDVVERLKVSDTFNAPKLNRPAVTQPAPVNPQTAQEV
jgi:phage terminase small subunit